MPLSIIGKGVLGVVALSAMGAYEMAPVDTREQTIFLERLAARIERAQQIAPETHRALSDILDRISRQPARAGQSTDVDARRELAIAKIESALRRGDLEALKTR
jgi:hypothetical protein